jgi:exonuclease VII large subunit
LRKRAAQTRSETEKLLQSELQSLSESLKESVKRELNTINGDIKAQSKDLSESLSESIEHVQKELAQLRKKRRLWPRLLLICLIICASSAGTITLQAYLTDRNLAQKQAAIETMNQTLQQSQTWGLETTESRDGSRYIILPPGSKLETGYSSGNRRAARIVSD